jgi:hypothetical protein
MQSLALAFASGNDHLFDPGIEGASTIPSAINEAGIIGFAASVYSPVGIDQALCC